MQAENTMIQTRLQPSRGLVKASKIFVLPEKVINFFLLLARAGLVLGLVASMSLAIHSAFSPQSRRFILPDRTRTLVSETRDAGTEPTNVSHILFGIGASVQTWRNRSLYSELWWDPRTTRGFVWLDRKPEKNILRPENKIPYRVSEKCWLRKYSCSHAAVRIARIVLESYKLGLPNVRWFVMGDDDTVFFTDNLVSVLARYDHNQMYYIGANSESVEQDEIHTYDMAFGGGGFAISYPLAAQLVNVFDGCLQRYDYFYGSDQRIWACASEIGVPLTREGGFHQFDIRGDPYGVLAAHPLSPLVSLHHLDFVEPLFPNQTRINSLKSLIQAYRVDPNRIIQQSFCYDRNRKWSISIAWGYSVQIYPYLEAAKDLQTPLQTFKTWRSWSGGPFTFNTRPVSSDPCRRPVVYFLNRVQEVRTSGSQTGYGRFVAEEEKACETADYARIMAVKEVTVSTMKMDPQLWKKAPRRQCCEIMDRGSDDNIWIRVRKCRQTEAITI